LVRHFVRLKLTILANRIRSQSVIGTIGYFAMWAAGLLGGLIGGLAIFGLGRLTDEPGIALVVGYVLAFLGWMIVPPSLSALDETLDPRRFELLPIAPRRLTLGLLAAAAVTPGGLGTLVGLLVATVGSFPEWQLIPAIVVAVAVELMICLVIARLVTTLLSNLLSSRRARELVTLGLALTIGLVALLPSLLDDPGSGPEIEITITSLEWVEGMVWLPPGALASSVAMASEGRYLESIGLLVYGMAATALIGLAWSGSVRRMLTTAPSSGRRGRRRDDVGRTLALMPSWLRVGGPVGGLASKELRYLVRDNRVRSQLIGSLVPIVAIAFVSRGGIGDSEFAPFLATGIAFLIVLGVLANQFGFDGGSFWAYVVSPAPLSSVVRGKNLGWGIVAVPPVDVAALALGAWSGDFSYVAAAVLAGVGVLLVATAIGNFTSIYGAFRIPETNLFGSKGASGVVFFAVIISMFASGGLLLPLAALVVLPTIWVGPPGATVGALAGLGYATVIYLVAMRLTGPLLVERQQELLEKIDKDLG
jgi:ABC-2 type transport system permease protein